VPIARQGVATISINDELLEFTSGGGAYKLFEALALTVDGPEDVLATDQYTRLLMLATDAEARRAAAEMRIGIETTQKDLILELFELDINRLKSQEELTREAFLLYWDDDVGGGDNVLHSREGHIKKMAYGPYDKDW
jgi:hypothetical protein